MKSFLFQILIFALATTGCRRGPEGGGDAALETDKVVRRQFTLAVSAVGGVKPQVGAEVKVGSRVSGRLVRLHANLKDQVRQGQVIAELEKADLEAVVAQHRAEAQLAEVRLSALDEIFPKELAKAETDAARWEASVTMARKDRDRQSELLKENLTSRKAEEQAQERLEVAQAQWETARKSVELLRIQHAQNVKQAQAERDRARAVLANSEVLLSYAVITAPISGVVGSVSTQEGETVAAGMNAPTFVTIVDLSRLQVEAYVDEVDIGKVVVGQRAVFTVDAFPASEFEGKVAAIYPKATIQDNVVKYVVAIEIVTPYEGRLRPEMTASVSIQLQARDLLAVNARAVQREGGKNIVFVKVNGQPAPREVKLGWKDGVWAEVASGLEEGQEVFLDLPETEKGKPK
jgi:multidrug efflux pump subunit AcrA (membrane-fusion protein)